MAARVILGVAYGIDVRENDDYYVQTAENAMAGVAAAGNAGSFLVDSFPILQYLPDWFPGADFKRKAANWNLSVKAMPHVTMKFVHDSMVRAYSLASFSHLTSSRRLVLRSNQSRPKISLRWKKIQRIHQRRRKFCAMCWRPRMLVRGY